jgi:hypothetical protein
MDQRRRVLQILNMPEDWANLTREESIKVREAGKKFNEDHPFAMENAKKSKEAWDAISSSLKGIRDDMGAAFGPDVVGAVKQIQAFLDNRSNLDAFASKMHDTAENIAQIFRGYTNLKIILNHDVFGKKSLEDELAPNSRPGTFEERFDAGKFKDAITQGFLDALRQAGGPGYTPMAFHPGGGGSGGGYFGSAEYPAFDPNTGTGGGTGGGGTRGNRNNNRGNMKFGPLARSFGATHADSGGFAFFPDQASGDAAQHALLQSNKYQGLTLNQFARKYAEGSPDWAKTVGGSLGIGRNDIVNTKDPRLQEAIRKAEGTNGGNARGMDPMAPAGSGITNAAKTAVRSRSGKTFQVASWAAPNFQHFIDSYEKAGGVLGPNTGTLGTRPGNSSYHPLARAMDLNQIARGIRGGGVTLDRATEERLADDAGLWPGSRFGDAGHFEARNKAHALEVQKAWQKHGASLRDHIRGGKSPATDGSLLRNGQRSDAGLTGCASLTIDLNGFPRGTKTASSHEGLFKEVTLNRGRPMSSAGETS